MADLAIRVEKLGKRYRIGAEQKMYYSLRESLAETAGAAWRRLTGGGASRADRDVWALKEVSFDVEQGEVLGVIGRNGAGKSTLLKILSRITRPSQGYAEVRGRVGSLLEVGTGFHPELTGRENVYLSGAILGMRKREINRKFDEIVAFAEVERFLDTPVKRYSSGMYVRLAFAVAAHLEPEILLVDEVLAVGDGPFQTKCLGRMGQVSREGRTVLFVSHNMKAVSALCNRAMLLDHGALGPRGAPDEVIAEYQRGFLGTADPSQADFSFPRDPAKEAQIERIRVHGEEGRLGLRHDLLAPFGITVDFLVRRAFADLHLHCEVRSSDGTLVLVSSDSDWPNYAGEGPTDHFPKAAGRYAASARFPSPLLNEGSYEIEVYLSTGPSRVDTRKGTAFEIVDNGSFASYVRKSRRGGVVCVPIRWDTRHWELASAAAANLYP